MHPLGNLAPWALLLSAASAAITIFPGGAPRNYTSRDAPSRSTTEFFKSSVPKKINNNETWVIMSSHDGIDFAGDVSYVPTGDSFVRGAIEAWGQHLHFVVRPDEVWFAVLVQMNYYMVSHAEEIRDLFVDHEGRERIEVWDFTWYSVIRRFAEEIQARVKTDWLLDWIMPNFSTSRETDYMTANVLMMGLMQQYFEYAGGIICGFPSVTLLGEKEDWEKLLAKLDRLADFGPEPEEFGARLKPIFRRFVMTFDEPDSKEVVDFWNTIAFGIPASICGDPYRISGWITAFFYWDTEGKPYARTDSVLKMDEVYYPTIASDVRVPVGWAEVPFIMIDFEGYDEYEATIVAGNLGKMISTGAPKAYVDMMSGSEAEAELSVPYEEQVALQPGSGWVLFGPREDQMTVKAPLDWALAVSSLRQCEAY